MKKLLEELRTRSGRNIFIVHPMKYTYELVEQDKSDLYILSKKYNYEEMTSVLMLLIEYEKLRRKK